jgi:hypothetical protein
MYYSDNKKFFTKYDALKHQLNTKEEIFFYYYDDLFQRYDWTIEPPETLDFYYKEQAQRIRDNYDYVILCFSGGIDSTNILNSFHFNNIKIDKIITVGAFSQDSHSMTYENNNGEIYFVAHPYLRELGLESITQHIDYTKLFDNMNQFSITKYGSEWYKVLGSWFSPHHWFWRDLPKYVVPSNIKDKKVAIIFGTDKPYLMFDERRRLGFRFSDSDLQQMGNTNYGNGCEKINFYWDKDFPLILIKQLHILKRAYNIKRTIKQDTIRKIQVISDLYVDELVYKLKKPLTYVSPKSPTRFLSVRDSYLLSKKNSDVYKIFVSGITNMNNSISGLDNFKSYFSKFYRIE